jgi:small conductance mechanosensitive channel
MLSLLADIDLSNRITLFHYPGAWLRDHGVNILIILIGTWLLRRAGRAIASRILQRIVRSHSFATETDRKKRLQTLVSLADAIIQIAIWMIAAIMIVDELGINTGPLIASAGVVGVALGIGAQSLIKDFVNGMFIIAENQYRVGDVVELNQQVSGTVQAITVRTTILRDMNGNVHHIPNGTITLATNKTFDLGRINEDITVTADTDLNLLEELINQAGKSLAADEELGPKIRKTPHFEQINGFNERGIAVKIFGETTPGGQWKVRSRLFARLAKDFQKHNIHVVYMPGMMLPKKKS